MKRNLITAIFLLLSLITYQPAFAEVSEYIKSVGFHKRTELTPELQIKKIFCDYEKASNSHDLVKFLSLHDESYSSADGYNKKRLKDLAIESWKEYPAVKYTQKVISVNVDLDNATVMTQEKLNGISNVSVEYVKGNGYITSEATAIYYLKRFSNEWKIVSDFVINEKTSMRYGVAKYIPMQLDAQPIAEPNQEYTAMLKVNVPKDYVALVSINNEPITFPMTKSKEVFRTLKNDGIQERILISNKNHNNENAIASIGIARPNIKNNNINVNIIGIAFLSSRVNVVKHPTNSSLKEKDSENIDADFEGTTEK